MSDTNLEQRVEELEEKVRYLESKVTPEPEMTVRLYVRQQGWTSAPSVGKQIGVWGRFGQGNATLTLEPGRYTLLETYTIKTEDYGVVRWIMIKTGIGDRTTTSDGFAWLPVEPKLVDAENLYNQLRDSFPDTEVDDYTDSIWTQMKKA